MKARRLTAKATLVVALTLALLTTAAGPAVFARELAAGSTPQVKAPGRSGVSQTVKGVTVTLQQLRSRPQQAMSSPREASKRRPSNLAASPSRGSASTSPAQVISGRNSPQTLVDEILGPAITDTIGFVPPDTMGAVGPTQFLFSVNGRFRGFDKAMPHTQIFDFTQVAFWGSTADVAGVSDAHVRYDRTTQRWFIVEIDVKASDNHILLAVSSSSNLATATWTQYQIAATGGTLATDMGCFDDYPTPGIDGNGIYIGGNMFGGGVAGCPGGNYQHSNLYVIQKSSAITGPIHVTTFYNTVPLAGLHTIETIQGVDSVESPATGYAVAVKEDETPSAHLNLWQINNPGTTTPTLTGPTTVAINAENGAMGGVLSLNNVNSVNPTRMMDDLDDRLFSAEIRGGHLWTAHNLGVDSAGNSNGVPTRDAVRWYDVIYGGVPTLHQSGTVFDAAASGFLEYWMGTIMVSGQGHAAMGLNRANSTTVVQAGAVGRLSGDALGTMGNFSTFQSSTTDAYTDAGFNPNPTNRWGDFTYTSLDPCDDMTMWTAQEYIAGPTSMVDWQVAAEKLQAPPPATPSAASPSVIQANVPNVSISVTGTSASGSGFYDTPSTITDPCRTRMTATVSGGVTVTSVAYIDATHITLQLSTVGATTGLKNLTVTNPDGQVIVANNLINIMPAATLSSSSSTVSAGSSVTATWGSISGPTATDWIGFYAAGAPNSAVISWRYTAGTGSGSVPFAIPAVSAGTYELRLFGNSSFTRLATSAAITVQAATLSATPTPISPGGSLNATWSGIVTPTSTDWIAFYAAGAPNSALISWRYTTGAASGSVAFNVPSVSAGTYELRLFANSSFALLATSGAIVVQVANLSASPSTVAHGGSVTATWSGIVTPTSHDWIALYAAGAPNSAVIVWRYTTGAASGNVPFSIPGSVTPGTYELRLFANSSFALLATSGPITVT